MEGHDHENDQQQLGEPTAEPVESDEGDEPTAQTEPVVEAPAEAKAEKIWVVSSVNVQGLARGRRALVDPSDPYIAGLLRRTIIVPEVERYAPAE